MDDQSKALAYYRAQSDELGTRLLRLQEELTQARRETRRSQTLALTIQRLYGFAEEVEGDDQGGQQLSEKLLMLMIEHLRIDQAALLRWHRDLGRFEILQAIGLKGPAHLSIEPDPTKTSLPGPPSDLLDRLGFGCGAVITTPPLDWVLAIGHRQRNPAPNRRTEQAKQAIAEAALKVFASLQERQVIMAALRKSEANYRELFESAQDAFLVLDIKGTTLIDANQRAFELFACSWDSLPFARPLDWLVAADQTHWRRLWRSVLRARPKQVEARLRTADGRTLWAEITFKRITAAVKPRILAVVRDITERKRSEAEVQHLAYYDPLTDLPNRRLFLDRLTNAQATSERNGIIGAVFFLDLDNFKQINDARGHEAGDWLLREVATRLRSLLRKEDTIARFGGDEFVILVADLSRSEMESSRFANLVAEKVRQSLSPPIQLSQGEVITSASIGITLFRGTESSVHDILRQADTALYQAKEAGRNCLRFFEPHMQQAAEERFDLERELRHALNRDELLLYYQPQIDTSGRFVGAEALVRWHHPDRGMISPAVFIPIAEDTGLIMALGRWVLTQACRFLAHVAAQAPHLRISVNVSPRQFHRSNLLATIRETLDETGAAPERLTLEITEGVLIEDLHGAMAKMSALKGLGIKLSIDDFGTGYSSLTYLKRMPVDELKIDRSFVQDVPDDSNDAALIEAILAVCQHLRVQSVAEGVETIEQHQFLRSRGCNIFQGFLFGRPSPAENILESLASSPCGSSSGA